ncbi:MAG: insulinase family protein [Gammaproteobacteria bacterium]|nr:insulinase family protein [Gammaproteobacteria bacterium]
MLRYLILISLLVLSGSTHAASSNIHEYTLKNGLKLIVKEDHRAPVAIFQIWYRIGGSYEPNGITGISHVVEHMMFQGTTKYPNNNFSELIAANGGILNAFTNDDFTAYYEELAANKIPLSFELEADRMHHATLSDAAFKKEIQVVMEERRMRFDDQPMSLAYERLRAAAFLSNPYHHMTIGWMGDLQNMTANDVRHWYQQWYTPNNAAIVIVGDVQPVAMYQLAQKYFASIPARILPAQKPVVNQTPLGTREVTVELPANVPVLYLAYNVPVLNTAHQVWEPYALQVLAEILGGSNSSRLMRDLVRGQQLAVSASTNYDPMARLDTIFVISGIPAQGHTVAELQTAINQEIKTLQQQSVSNAELSRIKAQLIAGKIYAQDSLDAQANIVGSLLSVGLPWQLADTYLQNIERITSEQIQAVAKKYLIPQRLTIGILIPQPMALKKPSATPTPTATSGVS